MYKDLKKLMGSGHPSARKFLLKLSELSDEEQERYYKMAFDAALCEWEELDERDHLFLFCLLRKDWERTIAYFRNKTVLGRFTYHLREPLLFRKLLRLFEGPRSKGEKAPSYIHLAFCCFLAFDYQGSVEYFGDNFRKECANTDCLCELLDIIDLTNENGCPPPDDKPARNSQ
nr:hypothetical protein [Parabacteroides goldsteinii]